MVDTTETTMFLNINDTAAHFGLARSFVRAGCIAGRIPHIKCGQKYMINIPMYMEQLNTEAEVSGE
ncbi:MAG: hypothetical protein LIO57_00975 [Oscillospiraceae bacterium]|nr:hypothetical protein [Oscillospiraceae bacterium]